MRQFNCFFALFRNDLDTHLKQHCGSGIFILNQVDEILALMFAGDIAAAVETARYRYRYR
ncbi:hypothetical protein DPMN_054064 [Dreissena polymorpha]|uniref:Uncharacterized protein n=1 Tax=Dreissena polymorpha TaxID=45954 RepID=A0A9D4CN97_DREPO|nr:hypothetical protein DPMN_054064 [Dreissena polymorpha]